MVIFIKIVSGLLMNQCSCQRKMYWRWLYRWEGAVPTLLQRIYNPDSWNSMCNDCNSKIEFPIKCWPPSHKHGHTLFLLTTTRPVFFRRWIIQFGSLIIQKFIVSLTFKICQVLEELIYRKQMAFCHLIHWNLLSMRKGEIKLAPL